MNGIERRCEVRGVFWGFSCPSFHDLLRLGWTVRGGANDDCHLLTMFFECPRTYEAPYPDVCIVIGFELYFVEACIRTGFRRIGIFTFRVSLVFSSSSLLPFSLNFPALDRVASYADRDAVLPGSLGEGTVHSIHLGRAEVCILS